MKKPEETTAATRRAYESLGKTLIAQGVEMSAMFGMPSFKYSGKAFAGLFGDAMVFKLAGDSHTRALTAKGAKLFDPSGEGRAMKAWVVVPASSERLWPQLAAEALEALGGEVKTVKKKPAVKKKKTPK